MAYTRINILPSSLYAIALRYPGGVCYRSHRTSKFPPRQRHTLAWRSGWTFLRLSPNIGRTPKAEATVWPRGGRGRSQPDGIGTIGGGGGKHASRHPAVFRLARPVRAAELRLRRGAGAFRDH